MPVMEPPAGIANLRQLQGRLDRLYAQRTALEALLASLEDYHRTREKRLKDRKRKVD